MAPNNVIDVQTVVWGFIGLEVVRAIINQFGTFLREKLSKPDNSMTDKVESLRSSMATKHDIERLTWTVESLSKNVAASESDFSKKADKLDETINQMRELRHSYAALDAGVRVNESRIKDFEQRLGLQETRLIKLENKDKVKHP